MKLAFLQMLRNFMASDFISVPPSLMRKLLGADLRPECSLALLRTVTALKKLEPWALRLIDATGKYPTGALQLSRAELGAFDECLETEVIDAYGNVVSHGQYCNLLFNLGKVSFGAKEMQFLSSLLHPKSKQLACWCVAVACVFCVIFMKLPWYKRRDPTTGAVKLVAAFFGRFLWSLFLSLLTLACATERG
ncbi:hypothetical protein MTO96_032471, partial [Rhipicephalus appendiculatus]